MQGSSLAQTLIALFLLCLVTNTTAIADTQNVNSLPNEFQHTAGEFQFFGHDKDRRQNSAALSVGDNTFLFWGSTPAESIISNRKDHDPLRQRIARADYVSVLASPKLWNAQHGIWQDIERPPECKFNQFFSVATLLKSDQVLITGGTCDRSRYRDDDLPNIPYTAVSLWDVKQKKWLSVSPMVTSRFFHTATQLNNSSVLIVGGESDPDGLAPDVHPVLKAVEMFSQNTMELRDSLNVARAQHTATLLKDGSLLVVGGYDAKGTAINAVERGGIYSWKNMPPLKTARYGHSASLLADGKVLIAGGTGVGGKPLSSVEIYDPEKNSWADASPLLQTLSHPLATNISNGDVVIIGSDKSQDGVTPYIFAMLWSANAQEWAPAGFLNSNNKPYALFPLSNDEIGIATDNDILKWRATKPITMQPNYWPRLAFATCALQDGKLFIAGGKSQETFLDWAEIFDPVSGEFQLASRMQTPRGFAQCLTLDDGSVLVAGGWARAKDNTGSATDYSPEIWNAKTNEWHVVNALTFYKHEKVVFGKLKDGTLLFIASNEFDDSAELLQFSYRAMIWNPTSSEVTPLSVPVTGRFGASIAIAANGNVLFSGGFKRTKENRCADTDCASSSADYTHTLINSAVLWNIYTDGVTTYPIDSNQRTQSYALTLDATQKRLNINALAKTQIAIADTNNDFYTLAAEAFSLNYTQTPQPGHHWDSNAATWQTLPPLITLHSENLMPLAGGALVTSSDFFDSELNTWAPLANQPSQDAHSVLASDGKLFSFDFNRPPYVSFFSLEEKNWKAYFNEKFSPLFEGLDPVAVNLGEQGVMVISQVAADFGTNFSARIWNPETNLWREAGRLSHPYSKTSALKLPSGKVIFLGGTSFTKECEIWSPLDNIWNRCGTFSSLELNRSKTSNTTNFRYSRDADVKMRALSDGRAAIVLENDPNSIYIYDEVENEWRIKKLEVDNSEVPFGSPVKTKQGYYARVFDEVTNQWIDASEVAAVNFRPDNYLWNPLRKYWEYVGPPAGKTLGTDVIWTLDGCPLSIPYRKRMNQETGKIEDLILEGVAPFELKAGTLLPDGSLVLFQNNLPVWQHAVNCNGVIQEKKIEPIVKKNIPTAAAPVSLLDKIHLLIEDAKRFLDNFSLKILGITFLLCSFILFIKISLYKRKEKTTDSDYDFPQAWHDPKAKLTLKVPLRIIVYTILAIFIAIHLRNIFAIKKINDVGMGSCSTLKAQCLDQETGLLKPFKSAITKDESSKQVSIPCEYVGIWSSIKENKTYRIILREDGTFDIPAVVPTYGNAYKGHWGVQGNKIIWSYAEAITDEEDVNDIHLEANDAFTLKELNGKITRYELIKRIKSATCHYD